jgi:hypothetical protein
MFRCGDAMDHEILAEFDRNPEYMAAEIRRLRETVKAVRLRAVAAEALSDGCSSNLIGSGMSTAPQGKSFNVVPPHEQEAGVTGY